LSDQGSRDLGGERGGKAGFSKAREGKQDLTVGERKDKSRGRGWKDETGVTSLNGVF